jgi:ABC-type transport system involved in multi-copper enzyme maturation permease subunit
MNEKACRVTFARVVRAEWTKLLSLRSTWAVLGAAAILTIGLAGVIGAVAARDGQAAGTVAQVISRTFLGIDVFSLILGVFGILLMTGEYGSGSIRATLTAVPRRLPVLLAKALVLVAATGPLMLAVCFASLLAGQAFTGAGQRVGLADPEVLRATVGAAAAPVALGLLGLGIGAMVRHTAGAITTYVAAMLVVPALLPAALPGSVRDSLLPYVPVAASQAMYAVSTGDRFPMLSPVLAVLVLLGWVLLVLAGGAAVLQRRDA